MPSRLQRNDEVSALVHQALLSDALRFAALPAFVLDDAGHYVAVNDAACALTGFTREELVSLRAGRDLAADPPSQELYDGVVRAGRAEGTARLRRKDESVVVVRYLTMQTMVSNLPYVLSFCWPAEPDGSDAAGA